MTGAVLSPVHAERLASQARAVARASFTHRKMMELEPRFGRPVAIVEGKGRPMPIHYGAGFDAADARFQTHPALVADRVIIGD